MNRGRLSDSAELCSLCAAPAEALNPLVPDEFYEDVRLHLHCLNSDAGSAWIEAKSEADPGYARYWSLITVRRPVACPSCGSDQRVSPKGSGMGAGYWELNCTACHRYRPLLSAYRSPDQRSLLTRIEELYRVFKLGRDVPEVLRQVEALVPDETSTAVSDECECGGAYSVAARPRCGACAHVLIDSPFHMTCS